ncbi:MAG: glycosyltransferase [Chloroflexi bacterium]|nr:glycosyltransferase [Chloroflexota bacterium]
MKLWIVRVIAVTDIILGLYYFYYRYTNSINYQALWFALPLLMAETYSFIGTLLFIHTIWRMVYRKAPPPLQGQTVDVFITTYQEPLEVLRPTVEAAVRIRYPHKTYVLDDGNRPEVRKMCEELGAIYLTRGPEWEGRPRYAKAGNVNNALMRTSGDFILMLDADQIPTPEILDRVMGYFRDPRVAFVQTPQYFYNVPPEDPFASQAPLFYGPIQQGKDGWNAAFFCGTNAVLRRDALMHLGVIRYVQDMEKRVLRSLARLPVDMATGKIRIPRRYRRFARRISEAAKKAAADLRANRPLEEVLRDFNQVVQEIQREIVLEDLKAIARDLAELEALEAQRQGISPSEAGKVWRYSPKRAEALLRAIAPAHTAARRVMALEVVRDTRKAIEQGLNVLASELAGLVAPPPEVLGLDPETLQALQLETNEALDLFPIDVLTVTEDMATALQLHALGWKSVFHPEILAYGLAPEDLGSALQQRFRWAVGTIQVFLRHNPLTKPGLTWAQRLQYFMTVYSYFSGFASIVYLLSPVIYLLFKIAPVVSFASEFLWRIGPYLAVNQLLFLVVGWGLNTWRGEQYSLALFPVWIRAVIAAFSGQRIQFQVTPKSRREGVYIGLVWPQLAIMVLLVISLLYAIFGLIVGWRNDWTGVTINAFWAAYDLLMLQIIVRASVWRPKTKMPTPEEMLQRILRGERNPVAPAATAAAGD